MSRIQRYICKESGIRTHHLLLVLSWVIVTAYLYEYSTGVSSVPSLTHDVRLGVAFPGDIKTSEETPAQSSKSLNHLIETIVRDLKPNTSLTADSSTSMARSRALTSETEIEAATDLDIPESPPHLSPSATKVPEDSVVIGCPFQNIDPFYHNETKSEEDLRPIDCSGGLPVFVYVDDRNRLRVNFTRVKATVGKLDYCEYTRAELSDENDSTLLPFKWSQKFLRKPLQLTNEDEHVFVQCFLKNNLVSQTFKGRVLEKAKVEERSEANYKRQAEKHSPLETMSVLIVGIDGMSKQNLIRTMPKTRNYILDKMHARELNMFNKVGDNTFPNILVFHSGQSKKDISKNWTKKQYFDDIEEKFIWHHYQNAVYRTSMGFDVTWVSAYHYVKKGWKHPTFDYYSRPLRLAMSKSSRTAGKYCVGELPELVVLQDYIHQMTSLFNNTRTKPYFIYNFYTTLTHHLQTLAKKGDDIYLNFFSQLHRKKVLNNTITIFFSDHGSRFGHFRETLNGKIETKTPVVFFMFPPWFEKKYPEIMKTFAINQNRLTTFFDLNKTLKDLLKFDGKTRKGSVDTRAISLFDEIPIERTCKHADIPMHYCNCKTLSNETVSDDVINVVSKELRDAIIAKTKHHRNICALLFLSSVKSVLTMASEEKGTPYYQVTLTTEPGGGLYEAFVKYDDKSRTGSVVGEITRLNMYRGQDGCVGTLNLKLYCFCKT